MVAKLVIVVLFAFAVAAYSQAPTTQAPPQETRFPAVVTDIDGRSIDVETLARDRNLVVVTLKSPRCPVCRQQLIRIRERLPDLEACGVSFLVLAPGTPAELAAVRKQTGFDFPFIPDEGLAIAWSLGLAMSETETLPCMFEVLPDRAIGWRQLGRSGVYFGDAELGEYFDCSRFV